MPKDTNIDARRDEHYRVTGGRHINPKASLPVLRSFADLKPLREKLRNEEDTREIREAKGTKPHRSADRLVRPTPIDFGPGVPAVSIDGGPLVLEKGGASGGSPGAPSRDAEEGHRHDEHVAADGQGRGDDDRSNGRSNVEGPDLAQHNVAFYVYEALTHIGGNERFTSHDLWERLKMPPDREDAVSAALSTIRQRGGLKITGRLRGTRYYVYMIDDRSKIEDVAHRISAAVVRKYDQPRTKGLRRSRPTLEEVSRETPAVDPHNHTGIEARVADHYGLNTIGRVTAFQRSMEDVAIQMPGALKALSKAVHAARLGILREFTSTELLNELQRRAHNDARKE